MTTFNVFVGVHPDARAATTTNAFYTTARTIIKHPLGWEKLGYTFHVFPSTTPAAATTTNFPSIHITLTPQTVLDVRFPTFKSQRLSLCNMVTRDIFINEERWNRWYDDDKSTMSLHDYRFYVINHELGHALGFDHARCPGAGMPAPIMLQQTLGLGGCTPTWFPSSPLTSPSLSAGGRRHRSRRSRTPALSRRRRRRPRSRSRPRR